MRRRLLSAQRLFPAALLLAACSGGNGDAANNEAAANAQMMQDARTPPQNTPVMNLSGEVDNELTWIEPQPAPEDPKTAPYGNTLSEPVVDAPSQPR